MLQSLFQSTKIPVLEQVVNFAQARHNVLAGNIANMDTPGYRVRDLSVEDFQTRLRKAIQSRDGAPAAGPNGQAMSPGELALLGPSSGNREAMMAQVSKDPKTILYHDDSNVGIEHQVTEMVKNQMQHNMALAMMAHQFQLLQVAISERV